MFAFPVWEFLLELLWGLAVWVILLFLIVGSTRLFYTIFYGE